MSIEIDADWLNEMVAREASQAPEYEALAHTLHASIVASASSDAESGDFAKTIKLKKIKTRKGVVDYVIESDHPGALAIEYGHLAGKQGSDDRTLVPGKHHFGKAIKKLKKG